MIFALNYQNIAFKLCETIYEEDGYLAEYYFTLTDDSNKVYKTEQSEVYVENGEVSVPINLKDLSKEVNIELSHLVSLKGYIILEDDIRDTGVIKYSPILQHKIWKRDSILNNAADETQKRSYKKTTPLIQGEEVKLIQKALQRMKIDIGKDGIDGKYGNDAKHAVETFQANYQPTHNLHPYDWADEPDGIVGKNTLLAMDEALVSGWGYEIKECNINSKAFFIEYQKKYILKGNAKENIEDIFDEIKLYYLENKKECNLKYISYMLATIKHETAETFKPIDEYGGGTWFNEMYDPVLGKNKHRRKLAIKNGNTTKGDGIKYHGRGFVQLTWKNNYQTMKDKLNIDFVKYPEKVLELKNATKIMICGMEEGLFTGKKLSDYINDKETNYLKARYIINGVDKRSVIATYAQNIEKCLKVAK